MTNKSSPFGGGGHEISADCFGLDLEDLDPFNASKESFRRAGGDDLNTWDSFTGLSSSKSNKHKDDTDDAFQVDKTRRSSSFDDKPPKSMRRLGKEKDRVSKNAKKSSRSSSSGGRQQHHHQQQNNGFNDDNFLSSVLDQMDDFDTPKMSAFSRDDDPFNIGNDEPSSPMKRMESPRSRKGHISSSSKRHSTTNEHFVADFDGFPTLPQRSVNSKSSRAAAATTGSRRNQQSTVPSTSSRTRTSRDRDRDHRHRTANSSRSRDQENSDDHDSDDDVHDESDNSEEDSVEYNCDDENEGGDRDWEGHDEYHDDEAYDDYRDRERGRCGTSNPGDRSTRGARSTLSSTTYKKSTSKSRDSLSRWHPNSQSRRSDSSSSKKHRNIVKDSLGKFGDDYYDDDCGGDDDGVGHEGEMGLSSFLDKKSTRRLTSRNGDSGSVGSHQNSIKSAPAADRDHYRQRRRNTNSDDASEGYYRSSRDNDRSSTSASPHHYRRQFAHPARSVSHEGPSSPVRDDRRRSGPSSSRNRSSSGGSTQASPSKYSSRRSTRNIMGGGGGHGDHRDHKTSSSGSSRRRSGRRGSLGADDGDRVDAVSPVQSFGPQTLTLDVRALAEQGCLKVIDGKVQLVVDVDQIIR